MNGRTGVLRMGMAAGAILWMAQAVPADDAPALPLARDIRAQVDSADYRGALKALGRVLDLKGQAAAAYDRGEMQLLKAECLLQIHENKSALDTLETARKEAVDSGNSQAFCAALAFTDLISHSPGMKFAAKNRAVPLAKPIDILDRKARPEAYKQLFADEFPAAREKVLGMQNAHTLSAMLEAAKQVATVKGLEKAGTGQLDQSKALVDDLSPRRAGAFGPGGTRDFSGQVDVIAVQANTVVPLPVMRPRVPGSDPQPMTKLNGLQGVDRHTLAAIQQELRPDHHRGRERLFGRAKQ